MKIWLRILGGAYILVGSLNSFVFLFILGVYGGKGGVEAIRVEEYVPGIGHLRGWVLYVLFGFSIAHTCRCRPSKIVGLVRAARIAFICRQSFYSPVWDDHRIGDDSHLAFETRPSAPASCSLRPPLM